MRQELRREFRKTESLHCRGLCTDSCGPIPFNDDDRRRIRAYCTRNNIPYHDLTINRDMLAQWAINPESVPKCPYLVDGRCTIYPVRPVICKLWGAVEGMKCMYGCVPDDGYIPDDVAREILNVG